MPKVFFKSLLAMLSLAAFLFLVSCGGGGSGGSHGDTFVPETKSLTIGKAGGTVEETFADGTAFKLEIPAGALSSDTAITLTTQKPVSTQRFNLLLEPKALLFNNGLSATLTISLPEGKPLPSTGGMIYNGALIPFTKLPNGDIVVAISSFAGSAVLAKELIPSDSKNYPKALLLAAQDACGAVPYMQSEEGLSAIDVVEIEVYGQCMLAAVNSLVASGQFEDAVRVSTSVAAYLEKTGQGDIGQYLYTAQTSACSAYSAALATASSATINGMGSLYEAVTPVLFWEATVQKLGASCQGFPPDAYQTIINTKTGEAVAYYETAKPGITDVGSANYEAAKEEAVQSTVTVSQVMALDPPLGLKATLDTEINDRAQPGILDAMLQAPWDKCHDEGDYTELISLMETLNSPFAVIDAAQYCGTTLDAKIVDNDQNVKSQMAAPIGGVDATTKTSAGTIDSDKTGILSLTGPIRALPCPNAQNLESLKVMLDGYELDPVISSPYFSQTYEINLASALAAAHPGGVDELASAELTFERNGSSCADFWGENPSPLLTLQLDFGKGPDLLVIPIDIGSDEGTEVQAAADGSYVTVKLDTETQLPMSLDAQKGAAYIQSEIVADSSSTFGLNLDVGTAPSATFGSSVRGQWIVDITFPTDGTLSWSVNDSWLESGTTSFSVINIRTDSSYEQLYLLLDIVTGETDPRFTATSINVAQGTTKRLYFSFGGVGSAEGSSPKYGNGRLVTFTFTKEN